MLEPVYLNDVVLPLAELLELLELLLLEYDEDDDEEKDAFLTALTFVHVRASRVQIIEKAARIWKFDFNFNCTPACLFL